MENGVKGTPDNLISAKGVRMCGLKSSMEEPHSETLAVFELTPLVRDLVEELQRELTAS